VVEAVGEVFGEELLGGAKHASGLAGWGENQRRLPSVRCSWRKMTAKESQCLASLSGVAGMLLVQEGRGDGALLLVPSDSSEAARRYRAMTGEAAAVVEHSSEEAGPNGGRRSRVGGGFLGDVWSMDKGGWQPTWGGDDRGPPVPSALRMVSMATGNRVVHRTGRLSRAVKMETGH
jgi:hypothetical protein